ncbi:MAG TPA: hypothetical protein VNI83_11315, partial [Vicinamibacterales bacterium]|nr:hypothetical protein [Vicinamibacterales bacterium]
MPTMRLVCTEPGRATSETRAAPGGGGSAGAGLGTPRRAHEPNTRSTSARASAIEMSPAIATMAWSGAYRVRWNSASRAGVSRSSASRGGAARPAGG